MINRSYAVSEDQTFKNGNLIDPNLNNLYKLGYVEVWGLYLDENDNII